MRIHISWFILISSVLLMSCASNRVVKIDSTPQSARIVADGKEIGKTPLEIVADEVFPPRWIGTSYMVKGNLELIKPECEPVSMKVNDLVLSHDINQQLKCSDEPALQARTPTKTQHEKKVMQTGDLIEKRLETLNQLQQKGLITDEEYKTQRQRILNEL